jgi:23S rRNA pseudouridine2605 synthase
VPKAPLKQLNQREKDKATTVFVTKVRKQRGSILNREPREPNEAGFVSRSGPKESAPRKSAPKKPVNRRIRQSTDLAAPAVQKKSDRNRGRG